MIDRIDIAAGSAFDPRVPVTMLGLSVVATAAVPARLAIHATDIQGARKGGGRRQQHEGERHCHKASGHLFGV